MMKKRLVLWIALVFLAILPSAIALAATAPQIPANAVTFNGHSYYLYKKEVTWPTAKKECEKAGGHLVTISNAAENNLVLKLTDKIQTNYHYKRAWIGLSDFAYTGRWEWVTGESVKYTNWVFYNTDPKGECAFLVAEWPDASGCGSDDNGCWDTGGDDWTMAYVCEWDSVSASVSAPKSVKADQPASNTVRLVWSAGKNARQYVIWRRDGLLSEYKKIGTTKKLTFVYTDKTVKNGGTYQYKVQAVNGAKSAFSSAVKAYPMAKVSSLKAKHVKDGKIELSWKKVSGATKYYVYRKGPEDTAFKKVKTVALKEKTSVSVYPGYGKYQFYVTPVHGSFEGMMSKKVKVDVPNPVVYRALIIGNTYQNTFGYDPLPGSDHDREGVEKMLQNLSSKDYNYQIWTLKDATVKQMKSKIQYVFSKADKDDVTLLFYSGHGENGLGLWYHGALTGDDGSNLDAGALRNELDRYKGKKVVFLNSCYSGFMIGKGKILPGSQDIAQRINSSFIEAFASSGAKADKDLAAEGYYVMTACRKDQEGDMFHDGGLFTSYLLRGLGWDLFVGQKCNLEADANHDNKVSFQELFAYIPQPLNRSNGTVQNAQVYPTNCSEVFFGR